MAIYTVRVVLRGAEWDTYEKLHESMQASGYTREVTSDDGVVFKLPDAEYVTTKTLTSTRFEMKSCALQRLITLIHRFLLQKLFNGRGLYRRLDAPPFMAGHSLNDFLL